MPTTLMPGLERRLKAAIGGDVLFGPFDRGRYATDASHYQMMPLGVVVPRTIEEAERALAVARAEAISVLARGGGTSQSGQTVNIPHVLATYYDNAGRVIWVSDGYIDRALLPQTPVPFAVDLRDDQAANVQSYRVTVNHYSLDKGGL